MQLYEPSATAHVVRKLLMAVVAFGTTVPLSFMYYVVWMLPMFALTDKQSSTVLVLIFYVCVVLWLMPPGMVIDHPGQCPP
jgi:hypothetical protein